MATSNGNTHRRLAAILATDVVGYSRLMSVDEAGTLAALKSRRREVLNPLVVKHGGRLFKLVGDGALVSGCPNGCSRPYIAEIALTGRAPGKYNLYFGGGFHGQRLNKMFLENAGEAAIRMGEARCQDDWPLRRSHRLTPRLGRGYRRDPRARR